MNYNLIIELLLLLEIIFLMILTAFNRNTFGQIILMRFFVPFDEMKIYTIRLPEKYIKKILNYNRLLRSFYFFSFTIIFLILIVVLISFR